MLFKPTEQICKVDFIFRYGLCLDSITGFVFFFSDMETSLSLTLPEIVVIAVS